MGVRTCRGATALLWLRSRGVVMTSVRPLSWETRAHSTATFSKGLLPVWLLVSTLQDQLLVFLTCGSEGGLLCSLHLGTHSSLAKAVDFLPPGGWNLPSPRTSGSLTRLTSPLSCRVSYRVSVYLTVTLYCSE